MAGYGMPNEYQLGRDFHDTPEHLGQHYCSAQEPTSDRDSFHDHKDSTQMIRSESDTDAVQGL